tara:strand:+ start:71547 stop:71720 length:174 start_codon:yes stop_codon:yes gene_type:complete
MKRLIIKFESTQHAYNAGFAAFYADFSLIANPFEPNHPYFSSWASGWLVAKKQTLNG